MKKIVLIFLLAFMAFAKSTPLNLSLFVNYNQKEIELKWFTPKYSSKYRYEIYRAELHHKGKLIKKIAPIGIEELRKRGYDDDYIFMIYPFSKAKTLDDKIMILQIEEKTRGFRLLRLMRDAGFARNIGQYYKDFDVKKDKIYRYIVVTYIGKKMIYHRSILAHTYKKAKRDDFMWVKATALKDTVGLMWDVQDAFAYYNVYRKLTNEKKFKKLNKNILYISRNFAQKAEFLYKDTTLKVGKSATYYIRKIDMFGKEGNPSKHFSVKLEDPLKTPATVRDVFITNSDKKRVIRWGKSSGNLGYNVYRSTIYQGNFRKINKKPTKNEVFYDTNFKSNKNYYYYITAVNLKGESKPSTIKLAYARDTTSPKKVKNLKTSVKAGEISFKWEKVKDNDLVGYRLYQSMDIDAKQWSLVNKDFIKKNSFVYKMPKTLSRFPYYYYVTAVDKTYNEGKISNIVKVKLPDVTTPKQPFVTNFRVYSNKIVLSWNKIVIYDFDHYNIYRQDDDKLLKLNKKSLLNRLYEDKNPKNGINEYIVTAVDKSGNESFKTLTKKIELLDITPVKIENLKLIKSKNSVKISFTCRDEDYAGFKLFRRGKDEPNYTNISNFIKSKSYIDKSLSKNTKYFYMVKAYDKSGNIRESRVLEFKLK